MKNMKLISNKKILVLGSAVIDVIINIDKLPKPGEDIPGFQQGHTVGGCAYNVSKILDYLKIEQRSLRTGRQGHICGYHSTRTALPWAQGSY